MNLTDILKKSKKAAVIGATQNKNKYGYKILKDLTMLGITVIGVNPKYKKIEDIKVVETPDALPHDVDLVSFVVPPQISKKILEKWPSQLQHVDIWFQPGSYNKEVIKLAKTKVDNVIYGVCILKDGIRTLRHKIQ